MAQPLSKVRDALRRAHESGDEPAAQRLAAMVRQHPQFQDRDTEGYRQALPEARAEARAKSDRAIDRGFSTQIGRTLGVGDEIAGAAGFVRQGAENLYRTATGQPIEVTAADRGRAMLDADREEGARIAAERPGVNTAATIGGIVSAAPTKAVQAYSAIRAGLTAGAINAPFAVARQEGDIVDRLPGAGVETAAVTAGGAALQGVANKFLAMPREGARRAAQFEAAGVRPTYAAVMGDGAGRITKAISENPIAGIRPRQAITDSVDDTARAVDTLARQSGTPQVPTFLGERIQEGVQNFSRADPLRNVGDPEAWRQAIPAGTKVTDQEKIRAAFRTSVRDFGNFASKADAIYTPIFRNLDRLERGFIGRSNASPVSIDQSRRVLAEIRGRVGPQALKALIEDPQIRKISEAIESGLDQIQFKDLRELRTWVRGLQANPQLRQGMDDAGLQRLEGALTADIHKTTATLTKNTPYLNQALRNADAWYGRGAQRIKQYLEPLNRTQSGEGVYNRVLLAAQEGGGGNVRQLINLRAALPRPLWNDVRATVISKLGQPAAGSPDALEAGAFSVNRFVTNYAKMSPQARQILFGAGGGAGGANSAALRQADDDLFWAMENLAAVASRQKNLESMANTSNTAVAGQSVASIGGLVTAPLQTAGVLGGLAVTGEALTNPAFVKWLAGVYRAGEVEGGLQTHMARLATIAARDPAVFPVYADLMEQITPDAEPYAQPRADAP